MTQAAPAATERHHDRAAPAAASSVARHEAGPAPDLGNQAIQALAAGRLRGGWEIGGADDPEEREADRLAKAAVSGPMPAPCACGGRCPSCAGTAKLRRKAEDGAPLRRPARVPDLGNRAGRPLDAATRHHFEPRFGLDLGAVRIHDDPDTAHLARGIGARAFTIGDQIGFAAGRHRPGTDEGRTLLAHELAHVALGHGGVRRVEDSDLAAQAEWREQQEKARAEAAKRHEAWSGAVDKRFGNDLTGQSKTIGEERQRLDLALTAQRAAAFDAAAGGEGWLVGALKDQGYGGPDLATVRQFWGEALVAAEGLALSVGADGPDSTAKLGALEAIPAFYDDLKAFATAVELAHQSRHDAAVETAKADYERRLKAYEDAKASDKASQGPIGEPGERAFRAGQAIMRGSPPTMATVPDPPKPISAGVDAARSRIYAAQTGADWQAVTGDVRGFGAGLSRLVVATLPETSVARQGVEYVEKLDERLAEFEGKNAVVWRIPATFYPLDKLNAKTAEDGTEVQTPEAIPWQFYLTNTGVPTRDQPARSGGEWVLTDLSSGQRFQNRAPASDRDSARLQQGEAVDPPLDMFSELNASIRFPEGRLYFTLPSGTSYVLTTTAPISLSDFLAGLGLVLAAIAITAGVIATGGAATPLAVAFYAGLAATGVGIASTLADLHEKDVQGILTSADVDKAMVSIGIDLVSALSMGLGRIVTAPGAAARFGARFVVLSRITQGARIAATAGDVWQALTVTESFVKAFDAINSQPELSEDQRNKMRAQLIRRALLTGAMMTIAIKGDISDLRAGAGLRVSHVDADGALVPHGKGEGGAPDAHPHADTPGGAAVPRGAPHADVSGPTHAASQRAGNGLTLGAETHAVGVAGSGPMRDIYFCSDRCARLTARIAPIVDALPPGHPAHSAFRDMLEKARKARVGLADGSVTREQADVVAEETLRRIKALLADTNDGPTVRRLFEMDPAVLDATSAAERGRIAKDYGIRLHQDEVAAQMRETASQSSGGASPLESNTLKKLRVTPSETLPNAPVEPYPARPADKPYFAGPQGIPPKEGDRIAQSLRQLLNVTDGNVAVAEAFINGERQLLTATSGGTTPAGTVALPDKTLFRVVNSGAMSRATDTEAKILEHLADRLPPDAKGTITIFTELAPCHSCSGVIAQFKERFPGITVIVTHR